MLTTHSCLPLLACLHITFLFLKGAHHKCSHSRASVSICSGPWRTPLWQNVGCRLWRLALAPTAPAEKQPGPCSVAFLTPFLSDCSEDSLLVLVLHGFTLLCLRRISFCLSCLGFAGIPGYGDWFLLLILGSPQLSLTPCCPPFSGLPQTHVLSVLLRLSHTEEPCRGLVKMQILTEGQAGRNGP